MSRPMPGPPEHDRMSWPHVGAPTSCELCAALRWPEDKHLTDAECAAEYWRALRDDEWEDHDMDDGYGPPNMDPWGKEWWPRDALNNERRLATWHRFATRPNALEPTP